MSLSPEEQTADGTQDGSSDELGVCESILLDTIDALSQHLASAAGNTGVGLNADDITRLTNEFKLSKGRIACLELSAHIHEGLLQHERELWDQTRRRPFERLLVKRISHLFPHEGELGTAEGYVSRRVLPGFFMAMEMMAGPELFEKCHNACKALAKTRKQEQGGGFLWRDFYMDAEANILVDDLLAVIVPHFSDFDKRFHWLDDLINSHLAAPEDYAFEGEGVIHWQLNDEALTRMLQALLSVFHQRLTEEGGSDKIAHRYGQKFCDDLKVVLEHLGLGE